MRPTKGLESLLLSSVLSVAAATGVVEIAAADEPTLSRPLGAPEFEGGPPGPPGLLFLESEPGAARADIAFLPENEALQNALLDDLLDAPTPSDGRRLIVTGAYSSGDRFGPEGFVLSDGAPTHPWPQGWDGLLLVGADGAAGVHLVTAVELEGRRYNLRDRADRGPFLARAEALGLSAIQSHLLIRDGALDLRPVEDAPSFRRRMLFQMADGRLGVYDTSPRPVTLYEGAAQLLDAIGPKMALNLDMGAYDFCERATPEGVERCGLLRRGQLDRLTNLIVLTTP